MAWRIIKQPNGLFARFSEVVDDFTHYNMTRYDVIDVCQQEYYLDDVASRDKLQRALNKPERFDEAIDIIKGLHGEDTANERIHKMS